jgi:hypothetical protein
MGFRKSVVKEGRRRVGCQRVDIDQRKDFAFECWSASCPSGSIFESVLQLRSTGMRFKVPASGS